MSAVTADLRQLGQLLAINALSVLAAIALMGWLLRRSQIVLAWLACAGLAWCLFGLSGSAIESWPFGIGALPLLYPLLLATLGSAASLLKVDVPRNFAVAAILIALGLAGASVPLHGLAIARIAGLAGIGVSLLVIGYFVIAASPWVSAFEKAGVAVTFALGLCAIALDLLADGLWLDLKVEFSPYAGVLLLGFGGFIVLRRMRGDADAQEKLNEALGQRIETTKANLLASESARHNLEVANAVKLERERLMREIHDGIGSSLVAALASAERQGKESTTAVVALKGALTDLRVAIDSLEPVEGNVATLLASLRYRYEPELRKSGIAIKWMVEDVPELDWLDAPSALHVLRILQETISNALGHSKATQLGFKCKLALLLGRPGLRIEVTDNGRGFDADAPVLGRGRRNMAQRAEALAGKLEIFSKLGHGTSVVLWLPLVRKQGLNVEVGPMLDE